MVMFFVLNCVGTNLVQFFKKIIVYVYLLVAVLGLCCCMGVFPPNCGKWDYYSCGVQLSHCCGFYCCEAREAIVAAR